jgi:hypothetical protein
MEIEFAGDKSGEFAADFYQWLRDESLPGVLVDRKRAPIDPNAMGAEFLPVILAIMSTPAALAIVRSLGAWLVSRRPKTKITLRLNGASCAIDTENMPDLKAQLDAATQALAKLQTA